ncbi:hypothetical protein [Corallococcus interemptor]|uniref:hypothetical protein n=1 Tax=Corallococcus interemptor TaxID=2316720 RepID=UPI0011C36170|nr:hypothetical protein [Corallococcus interemptor]
MKSSAQTTGGQLDADELINRLRLNSPDLAEELYKISKEYLASETARENNLNAKATSLLTASGLSLTVAFTFGGMLIQHPEYLSSLWGLWPYIVPIFYGVALLAGLSASAIAVWSLLIRGDYVGISEQDVFNPSVLIDSDRLDFISLPAPAQSKTSPLNQAEQQDSDNVVIEPSSDIIPESSSPEPTMPVEPTAASAGAETQPPVEAPPPYPKSGTAYYRRFMTAHIWQIARTHFDIHEAKAKRIKIGQGLFFVFLLMLAAIGVSLTIVALIQQHRLAASSQTTVASPGTPQPVAAQHPISSAGASSVMPPTMVSTPSASDGGTSPKVDVDGGGTTQIARDAGIPLNLFR